LDRRLHVAGFLDADPARVGERVDGVEVLGHLNALPKLRQMKVKHAIVAIGDNSTRQAYARNLLEAGLELINAIHPAATISPLARLGKNVTVAAGAVIGTDATIGDHVIINTSAVVDHECVVNEAAHICPGALLAGRV